MCYICFLLFVFVFNSSNSLCAQALDKNKSDQKNEQFYIDIIDSLRNVQAYDSAFYYADQLIEMANDTNQFWIAQAYGAKLQLNILTGNYQSAISMGLKGIEYAGKQKHNEVFINLYGDLAYLYNEMGDSSQAVNYSELAMIAAEKYGDKRLLMQQYQALAATYVAYMMEFDKSISLHKKSYAMAVELKSLDYQGLNLSCLGFIYKLKNNYKEAEKCFKKAIAVFKEINETEGVVTTSVKLAGMYGKAMNRPDLAIPILESALDTALNNKMERYVWPIYYYLSENYALTKQYKKAYEYHVLFALEEKKKRGAEVQNEVAALKEEFESEAKQKEIIELLERQKAQNQFVILLIGGILMALAAGAFSIRAFIIKRKFANFLAKEDKRKELLLQEIHHRVNNNLQIISSLLELQADESNNNVVQDFLKQSQNRIHSLSALHELLYENNTSLSVNISDYLQKVLLFHEDMMHLFKGKIALESNIQSNEIPARTAVSIGLIVNELITNSIKYAFPDSKNGKVKVQFQRESKNQYLLVISDDGVGMSHIQPKKGTSLGLNLVQILAEQINGELEIVSKDGTSFQIRFNV